MQPQLAWTAPKERAAVARAFVVKAVYNMPTTRSLLDRLECDKKLRRICGWEHRSEIPSESTFSRAFAEFSQREMDLSRRHKRPFTLAYIDLDNFKMINDRFGHNLGDKLLHLAVETIKGSLRTTDVVARLGGDEFAMLLPETPQEVAHVVVTNLRKGLLEEMRQKQWPITFSIGVLTCQVVPPTVDALVYRVDELMYLVKREGKDGIKSSVYAG